jgi:hypothetical protein
LAPNLPGRLIFLRDGPHEVPERAARAEGAKVESYLERQTPAHRKTIERLRRVVKSAVPKLDERMRWQQVGCMISAGTSAVYARRTTSTSPSSKAPP